MMVQVGGLSRNTSYWLVMSCTDTAGTILNSSLLHFTTGQCRYIGRVYEESPRGAASGLTRCNFFRIQTSLLSLFLVQMLV